MSNSDMPAMPTSIIEAMSGDIYHGDAGLSKREYFAALAMQGMVSTVLDGYIAHVVVAGDAVIMADELLKALEAE